MVPEIWTTTERVFFHFGAFFAVLPPPPSNNPEYQNFENMKKAPGDVIILHICTIKNHHMMYGS